MTASLIARHEVKDFAVWKEGYDAGAQIIKDLGVISESVHRDLDNPNKVTVFHQFNDVDSLKAFVGHLNERLKEVENSEASPFVGPLEFILAEDVQ